MKTLPTKEAEHGVAFTVADFIEAGRERLALEVLAGGKGLERTILEPVVNRPGLALTGFWENFAWQRVQLFGNSEMAYGDSLSSAVRRQRFYDLITHQAYVFIYTDGNRPSPGFTKVAEKAGVVLLATPLATRVVAREATFILEQLGAPRTSLYGTTIEVAGLGVMFEGDPGMGKSETALGLIRRGCALIADDLTCIRKDVANNTLYASACDATAGYMEIRGIGIMHVPSVFGINALLGEKQLQLVITFKRLHDIVGEVDRVGQTRQTRQILGVDIPNIIIPVSEGRDLVNLVETAAQQQKLILAGYNPASNLSERLHRRAAVVEEQQQFTRAEKRKGKRNG